MNWNYHARQIMKRAEARARLRWQVWHTEGVTQEWRDYESFYHEDLEKLITEELELLAERHAMEMLEFNEAVNGNG